MKFIKFAAVAALIVPFLFVGKASASVPTFQVTPSSFNFYYSIGGALPTQQSAIYTNVSGSPVMYHLSFPNQPSWINGSYSTDMDFIAQPNSEAGVGFAVETKGLKPGKYSTALYLVGDFPDSPVTIPVTLNIYAAGTSLPGDSLHPEGTNIVDSTGTVYRIWLGSRYPYTSAGAFLSYGYNSWEAVVKANRADLALDIPTCTPVTGQPSRPCYITPRDGSLINDHGTIYIISDGYRQGFANEWSFLTLGYSYANALSGDTSFLQTLAPINSPLIPHPYGTIVNDGGTICVMYSQFKGGGRRCFSNLADMNSWGIKDSDILPSNTYDREVAITGILYPREQYSGLNP